ncbi:MAG: RagB/SusD family nutrient uptake outer membrane protein [Bacteroidales bacterium]|nr:RagB/SusD family nutrient uptake outer membrane protein [Bacteroidales bacterium]
MNLISAFSLIFFTIACSDVLDKAPDGSLTMEEIFADPDKVEGLLNRCYENIPKKGYYYHFFDPLPVACSDDGWSSDDGSGESVDALYRDATSASNHPMTDWNGDINGNSNVFHYWSRCWAQIRLCSHFIENIDNAAVKEEGDRARFKAEAHLLRAFFYSELVKWFGKVPILDHTVAFDADFSMMKREAVYDVAKFIASDCDVAINTPELPWRITESSDEMRVTKALAHAIKTKMLLFAASPLHNEGNTGYWEEAYQAGQTAVTALKANGYELFAACTNPSVFGTGKAAAFHQLACQSADISAAPRDRETIWQHKAGGVYVWHIGYVGSNMDGTFKIGTCPTQELIDAFETDDGVPVLDLANPYLDERHLQPNYNTGNARYNPNDPYKNRDPRLYATALMNGDQFIWNNGEVITVDAFTGGKFAPRFDKSERSFTRTGYIHKKMVTPGASQTNGINNSLWKFYRLGELLLDYAEAAAEAGHLPEARAAVNEVRARVDMPALPATLSQPELILRIRNERRVELAWEEQRYFDLRRWQTPTGDLSATCKYFTAMVITKSGSNLTYTRQSISQTPRGGWQNKDLLLPVPLIEASRLEPVTGVKWQNPGW